MLVLRTSESTRVEIEQGGYMSRRAMLPVFGSFHKAGPTRTPVPGG
jgi:hypothetical protein